LNPHNFYVVLFSKKARQTVSCYLPKQASDARLQGFVSERLKGASDGRFKRGQFDRKAWVILIGGFFGVLLFR